jgi:hypothetical protein
MLTDKFLLITAFVCAIIGILGLFFFPPSIEEELLLIEVLDVHRASEGTMVDFLIIEPFSGYNKGNISKGSYYITASRGGNDFYYISSFKKFNGSN